MPAITIGSIRKGRFGHVAAEWLAFAGPDIDVAEFLSTRWLTHLQERADVGEQRFQPRHRL
ncbi:hypothetical protein AB0N62_04895 [Streptomyces sp. NPDC093982]|uniref:hypothetical protein n=1 Tax=Streptomyces sp. NPDC093982 TaxID=3155077 RepID=UPI00342541EC